MAELADAADLKSAGLKRLVGVRVPLSAPTHTIAALTPGIRASNRFAVCLASLFLFGQTDFGVFVYRLGSGRFFIGLCLRLNGIICFRTIHGSAHTGLLLLNLAATGLQVIQ
jgi:hypothetical protein